MTAHNDGNYHQHPAPSEVFTLIEVADSTIDSAEERDLTTKATLYAAAGISDYWVVNVQSRQLHIFREPRADGFQRQTILKAEQSVHLLAFPDNPITVKDCFGLPA
ncbi:MAG: Uma2 family endonuclease [Cyanobacteria bacterium J06560_2]